MSTKKEAKKVNKCIKIKNNFEAKKLVSFRVDPKVLQEVDERQAKDPIFKSLSRSIFIGHILQDWVDGQVWLENQNKKKG